MKTLDDFTREARVTEEEPLYVLVATAPSGKIVYGQPPLWGRYVLLLPEELLDDEERSMRAVPVPTFGLSFGYGSYGS